MAEIMEFGIGMSDPSPNKKTHLKVNQKINYSLFIYYVFLTKLSLESNFHDFFFFLFI